MRCCAGATFRSKQPFCATSDFGRATFFDAGENNCCASANKKNGPFFSTLEVIFKKLVYVYVVCVTWKRHKRYWERHRSPTIANGERSIIVFLSFLSINLGAAMLAPSYSLLRECKCDQLVSAPRHPKAS